MTGRIWLKHFTKIIDKEEEKQWTAAQWTEFMGRVLDHVAKKINCYVARHRQKKKEDEDSSEYLGIDAVFIDNFEYKSMEESDWNPVGLPRAAVELENSYDQKRISYCLWKLLCVRAQIRVLICYQDNQVKVDNLKERLEDLIWQGSLMKGTDADLLVIIGNEGVEKEKSWSDYFSVYEWRNDRLGKVKVPEW